MTFSEKLIILRKKKGMSQEQLAELLDVSRQSVSKWEAQQALPETAKIIMVANIFGVSIDLLLKDDQSIEYDEPIIAIKEEEIEEAPAVMYCTKCGKENSADSTFCGYCGNPFTPLDAPIAEQYVEEVKPTANALVYQPTAITFPAGFDYKKYCANCGSKIGAFSRTKIAGEMFICENCLSMCSNIIVPYIRNKSIADVKNDIARMNQYPQFAPTHQFGRLLFDGNNKLWKAPGYPVYRFADINDFDVVEERDVQSISYSTQRTKTKGGLGRALVGGALFGVPGAIVGGVTAKRKAVTIGNTSSTNIEYFTQLGIRIMLNDINTPSITINFIDTKMQVSRCERIVEEVNNAAGFLNIVLNNGI